MLKVRVIPTLLSNGFGLVKGEAFQSWRTVGTLVPAVRVFNTRDVDELLIVDVAARREGRCCDLYTAEDAAAESRVPLSIGGGITSVAEVQELLATGADKVVLNTGALERPQLIEEAATRFGTQCVVLSVDVRVVEGRRLVTTHSGSQTTDRDPVAWAKEAQDRGAGEILVTRVESDGLLTGYDLPLVADVAGAVSVPVIAAGGAGTYEHMRAAVQDAGASAVAAGAMFQFTEQTPALARSYLASHGIPVRH
jgi:cyclase